MFSIVQLMPAMSEEQLRNLAAGDAFIASDLKDAGEYARASMYTGRSWIFLGEMMTREELRSGQDRGQKWIRHWGEK